MDTLVSIIYNGGRFENDSTMLRPYPTMKWQNWTRPFTELTFPFPLLDQRILYGKTQLLSQKAAGPHHQCCACHCVGKFLGRKTRELRHSCLSNLGMQKVAKEIPLSCLIVLTHETSNTLKKQLVECKTKNGTTTRIMFGVATHEMSSTLPKTQ